MNNPLSFLRYVITIVLLCDNHKFDETKNKKNSSINCQIHERFAEV